MLTLFLFLYIGIKETYIMNKKIFLKNLDPSGKMYRKKYLEKHYPDILNNIFNFIKDTKLILPFKQQVYHWYNDIKEYKLCYCGNIVKFKNSTIGYYEYCSKKCMDGSNKVKGNRVKTNMKKFGTKTPSENNNIRNKIIETNLKKYGANSPLLNEDIKSKSIETLYKNYGVDNPLKSKEIRDKIKKTLLERYNVDNPKKSEIINDKIKKTMILRYGVEYALQNENIRKLAKKKQLLTLSKKIKDYYKNYNILKIDTENKKYEIMCEHGHIFEIDYSLLNSRRKTKTLICTECNPINKSISGLEIQMINFIEKNYKKDVILNDRSIINKELDIYLPDLKLAFEFNGLWWHNEINKPDDYHLNKTELCEEKSVQLIHIWEDDWIYKEEIVKSVILNKLGKTPNKIYGRKTIIKEITDNKIVREFLIKNHLQGFVGSKIKLGLYYEGELVSLMTFSKKRIVMNEKSNKDEWELNRFCNKINTNVIGSASKLFNYFINNYKPKEIITYANRSYSNGNLYKNLNFEYSHKTRPNYYYIVDKIRKHRFTYRKKALIKKGFDPNKTEHQIMFDRKIFRIYDSGQLKFKFLSF